ncbi:hypothetical protein L596_026838 [Steinernema carpocapsae]|nr:hypothetical protein L596_026838 [Steinernema carpocapsae]
MMQAAHKLTNVLFAHMRGGFRVNDRKGEEVLRCPRCSDRLEAMYLDDFVYEDKLTYQRVGWACRGLRDDSCEFPLDMPPEVFWTKRSLQEKREDYTPLPNFHLLPKQYRYLYPSLFPNDGKRRPRRSVDTDDSITEEPAIPAQQKDDQRSIRSDSPASLSSGGARTLSRAGSRMSMCSDISVVSKQKSVEERMTSPERDRFRALRKPVAPLRGNSPCLETIRRELQVNAERSPASAGDKFYLQERNRKFKAAIEKRAKKIVEATSNSVKVKDLDKLISIKGDANHKKVDLFNGPASTLKSLIYMRYATGDFLHAVQRKMTKEGISQPITVMTPAQKRMVANLTTQLQQENLDTRSKNSWLSRTKLGSKRKAADLAEIINDSEDEVSDTESLASKRTKSVLEKYTKKDRTDAASTSKRSTAADIKQTLLSKLQNDMDLAVSSRIGMDLKKLAEKKLPVQGAMPPRIADSSSESQPPVKLQSVTEEPTTVSSEQSTSTANPYHDDLSEIPESMRLSMFEEDPELNALVNRKLKKISQETVIYDPRNNLAIGPEHMLTQMQAYPMQQQQPMMDAGFPQPLGMQAMMEHDYIPSGLAANPNSDLASMQWTYDFAGNDFSQQNLLPIHQNAGEDQFLEPIDMNASMDLAELGALDPVEEEDPFNEVMRSFEPEADEESSQPAFEVPIPQMTTDVWGFAQIDDFGSL